MQIKTEEIKKIREETGAGMMDCKRALEKAGGDYQAAVLLLKEQGLLIVKKKEERAVREGRIFLGATREKAALLYLACETDFVARNQEFAKLGAACLECFFDSGSVDDNPVIASLLREAVARIKENICIKKQRISEVRGEEIIKTYLHDDGRIGALIRIEAAADVSACDDFQALADNLVLHVAAFAPLFVAREDVPAAYLNEQRERFAEETRVLDKPEQIKAGIVRGKLEKHLKGVCLLEQPFIRDDKLTVGEAIRPFPLRITDIYSCRVGE